MVGSNRGGSPVQIDALESRRLLAGASVIHDALLVRGGAFAANTIVVADSADGSAVDVTIDSTNPRGVTKHFNASFPKSLGFTLVRVRGGALNDNISFGDASHPFTLPVRVNGSPAMTPSPAATATTSSPAGSVTTPSTAARATTSSAAAPMTTISSAKTATTPSGGGNGNDNLDAGIGNDKLGGHPRAPTR